MGGQKGSGASLEQGLIKFGARPVHPVSASAMNSSYQLPEVISEELKQRPHGEPCLIPGGVLISSGASTCGPARFLQRKQTNATTDGVSEMGGEGQRSQRGVCAPPLSTEDPDGSNKMTGSRQVRLAVGH